MGLFFLLVILIRFILLHLIILLHLSVNWVKIRFLICQPVFFNSFLSLVNCKLTNIITSIIYDIKCAFNIDSFRLCLNEQKNSYNIARYNKNNKNI